MGALVLSASAAPAASKLAQFPAIGVDHDGGTHEAAEARAVGAEDDGHVAGVVDGANAIRGVVDVGRMQAGIAPVRARPPRFGTDEAHAGARRLMMHRERVAVEALDVSRGEELRAAVRTVDDAQLPLRIVRHRQGRGLRGRERRIRDNRTVLGVAQRHRVANGERAAGVTAKATERERRARAEIGGNVDAAAY